MTTENSRADELTDDRIDGAIYRHIPPKVALENAKALYAMAAELLAASPVEQPEAAPIGDARECLMDVVSHHDDFEKACRALKDAASDDGNRNDASYWLHQVDVLGRMKAQAERALAEMARPAPTPADERIAQLEKSVSRYQGMVDELKQRLHNVTHPVAPANERSAQELLPRDRKWVTANAVGLLAEYRNCKASETEEVMQQFVAYMQAALQDAAARAASANETGAQGST